MNTGMTISNEADDILDDLHAEAGGEETPKPQVQEPAGKDLQTILNEVEGMDLSSGKKHLADWAMTVHSVKLPKNKTIENMLKDFQKATVPKAAPKPVQKENAPQKASDGIDRDSHWADWDLDELDRVDLNRTARIDFSHITEAPENRGYEFAIVHRYPSGNIQKHEKRGWRRWEVVGDEDRFIEPGDTEASRHDSTYASVPVGAHEEGVQIAYLMYMPRVIYEKTILAAHKQKADAQLSIVVDPQFENPELVDPSKAATTAVKSNIQNMNLPADE